MQTSTATTFLFLLISFLASETVLAQHTSETHTVQQGETLFSISRVHDITVGDLRQWNDLVNDNLQPGMELRITPPETSNQVTHVVEEGETLFAISREYNVTIPEIQQWNNLDNLNIALGQELVLFPQDAPEEMSPPPADFQDTERESIVRQSDTAASNTYYIVKSGDSLYRISNQHNMTIDELRRLNNLESDIINVGQRLTVRDVRSAPSVAENAEDSTPQGRFVLYTMRSGENAQSLMEKFLMSEEELETLNPGLSLGNFTSGQRVTVLLPPQRTLENPYKKGSNLQDLGNVPVFRYSDDDIAKPNTSGELYNPDQLTAAHSNIALGNIIYIENPASGRGVYVRVNDRHSNNGLKVSHKAYEMLNITSTEQARVQIYLDEKQ
ncbi:MAG: LysM peptidoglycan-binding domain-containing protein [Balneolaceae bacterium]